MHPLRASVQVSNPDHPRDNQAGIVEAYQDQDPDTCLVRFDLDLAVEPVPAADLVVLGLN